MARFDWWREAGPDKTSAQAIVDRVQAEWRAEQRRGHVADTGYRPDERHHEAPEHLPGVDEAHRIMQEHRGCRADECRHKYSAWRVLIEAGHVKPDTSRSY
jgi:hypothetical protein